MTGPDPRLTQGLSAYKFQNALIPVLYHRVLDDTSIYRQFLCLSFWEFSYGVCSFNCHFEESL